MSRYRWQIWKHDCFESECKPMCDDPWRVDAPIGYWGDTFTTWAEAMAHVDKYSREESL